MRLVFLVEGKTEKESLKAFFGKWLEVNKISGVGIDVISLRNASRLFADGPDRARDLLSAPDGNDIIAVFSLMDLYGAGIYPDDKQSVEERYQWGKQEMESRFTSPKYKHFFAVHETEAWLLSQPGNFPVSVRRHLQKHANQPEKVNFDHPPAKVIGEQYLSHCPRGYGKTTDGRKLFGMLDPAVAREACPYLKLLLDNMLQLAPKAKSPSRKPRR